MKKNRINQIKYYTELLKDNEILLLKSCDEFFKNQDADFWKIHQILFVYKPWDH